ncbi:CbiX/SirB N-terminal domain-containing protein [Ruegeria sp.]|uniref:CbiX/SirB N-terminal domain-containing protein n=1 Tax=Ruegeria sp. TaxID=1879320 RepID=UPI002317EFC7|nr:CbiX/SirB N-terminal domain-containing protein [Ruegeria sp.]MDA7963039.1 cobalamin biosynthesis protein CbiX [Ruegeria sp.]
MPHAVIVAHGQPSDPDPAEANLAQFAARVDALSPQVSVHSATLAAPGALEACLDRLPEDTAIYPLFMARGWFVTSALPKRVGSRKVQILDPLGIDPDLPALAAGALQGAMADRGWVAEETDLVIPAHGSGRSQNPARVATGFADALALLLPFRSIRVGFVEQHPSISQAASGLGEQALCLPFFACTGGHVLDDVPTELTRAEFKGATLPVIGELPAIQRQIAAKLTESLGADPH